MVGAVLQMAVRLGPVVVLWQGWGVVNTARMDAYAVASKLAVLLLLLGTVGLYRRHRHVFGWPGRLGVALLLVDFVLGLLGASWLLPVGDLFRGYILATLLIEPNTVGSLLLGVAIARADELPHALFGGLLLAFAFPLSLGLLYLVVGSLGLLEAIALGIVVTALPYGAAWVILGFDLVTETWRAELTAV